MGINRGRRLCCVAGLAGCALTWRSLAAAQAPSPSSGASAADGSAPSQSSVSPPGPQGALPPASLADSLQGEAKHDYEAARLLYSSGDYAGALLKFQNAYRAAGDPRLLWDAAGCERNLRHYVKASRLVRQFLASQSPLVTTELANRAQAFLDAAQPLTAPLEVESNPQSAEVYLDDELLGTPGLASQAWLDLGMHRIVVKARGYQPYSETLTVVNSAKVHVTANLRALAVPMAMPPAASPRQRADHAPHSSALSTWVWIAGGGVVLAGMATASYFIFKPSAAPGPVPGSIGSGLRF